MATIEQAKREVIFLFGAGASVDAGIPDTYGFVKDFELRIEQDYSELHEALLKICDRREKFNEKIFGSEKRQVDVEQLLDTLRRLIEKEKDPLLDFFEEKKFCSTLEESSFSELKTLLENFIREKVIVEEAEKLGYLKELLKFDTPIEIYSTNYDTCIEQLSYLNHRRYTDGFDVYWNGKNFEENYDIKHYKMHGSVIWYQNKKTKECVKIPVHGFIEGKSVDLKLIYGEEVEPLLIYPAQKAEYVEPLTDLQLMFKQRLFSKDTKFVVIVGYSFRDDYIVHMLWDAARVNEDLYIILISPNSKEIFDNKLKFTEKGSLSRLHDRVICLPYPFSTVIYELKNHYLQKLSELHKTEKENIDNEKSGRYPDWKKTLQLAIDCEFLTKVENTFKRLEKNWGEIESDFLRQDWLSYAIKGLLSSVIVNDGNENVWIKRVNEILVHFNAESLQFNTVGSVGLKIVFRQRHTESSYSEYELRDLLNYSINSVFPEKERKLRLLSPMFEVKLKRINENFEKLTTFQRYISSLSNINNWNQYIELRRDCEGIDRIARILPQASQNWDEMKTIAMEIEKKIFVKTFGENLIQFKPL